jgi:hypothetical protein
MTRRLIALSLVAATAALPATALARNAADDPAPHAPPATQQAPGVDDTAPHLANGADDTTPHLRNGADDTTAKKAKRNRVRSAGVCSPGVTSKLVLKKRNGRVEAEFEVDQNKVGKTWSVTLLSNGSMVKSTSATTKAPSGSFEVKSRIADAPGVQSVKATATGPSGESCSATATI